MPRSQQTRCARSVPPIRPATNDVSLAALLHAREAWLCRIESALTPIGLSAKEYGVLRCLSEAGHPLTHGEIAARLPWSTPSTRETTIRSLEAKALIEPALLRGDRETARIRMTATGAAREREGARAVDHVSAAFTAAVPAADRAALDRIVSALG